MKNILLSLLFISSLFGQVNRILTIAPTAEEASLGNQSLFYRNPAKNHFNLGDTTTNVSFTRVNWLSNITDDMGYNYVGVVWKNFDFSLLYFDYGEQNNADESGVILNKFNPNSIVGRVGWGTPLKYKGNVMDSVSIGFAGKVVFHDLYTETTNGMLFDVGVHMEKLWNKLDVDLGIQNFGLMTKINGYEIENPTSLNFGVAIPLRDWTFYNQWNFYNGYHTHGQGISYKYKDMIRGRVGYYNDVDYQVKYPSFGMSIEYDNYDIGVGYIMGDETFPLSNTLQLTINVNIK